LGFLARLESACLTLGTVYGVDGLKTGGGGGGGVGGGGGTNCCISARVNAPPIRAIKVVTKHVATAVRPNLANVIVCIPGLLRRSSSAKAVSEHELSGATGAFRSTFGS
jgi:hypothetical protein